MNSSSPITQVSQIPTHVAALQPQLLSRLFLDLRGRQFEVDRDTIMNMPESVLLCLFPNGLVLSRQSVALQAADNEDLREIEEEVHGVDFDPDCFEFVLKFFRDASDTFYGKGNNAGLLSAQQHLLESSMASEFGPNSSQNPLLTKQAIIVLREELEYFAIPVKDPSAPANQDPQFMLNVKQKAGDYLLGKRNIFTALQRNVNKENNVAEQHLIDMLCMSGFDRDDEWGYRALEPSRCCISSIALVLLKTGITHPTSGSSEERVVVDQNQMATAQKLLLFWRKPARKCWWDGIEVEIPLVEGEAPKPVKLWARRVWTLELSLV